ncbi:LytR C-terminal domain-containing protein [Nocardia nepalensis]|uniref:LytR C-terminal domain-containing protein n=1 Tax=Nocardia nepalensis TaxID=3375448 RepID=UPI003B66C0D9
MTYPNPTSGGPPLRALAMVLIALAILFAGLGAMSLSSSDADTAGTGESPTSTKSQAAGANSAAVTTAVAPTTSVASTTTPTTTSTTPTTTPSTTTSKTPASRAVPVRVLNNSTVPGLAARTASELTGNGWTVAEVGNYPGPNISNTTVYYGNSPGEKEAALAIAEELGATAELRSGGSGSGVTVVVTGN